MAEPSSSSSDSRRYRGERGRRRGNKKNKGSLGKGSLSNEDLEYLTKHTKYDAEEIKEWYRGFKSDCPDGTLGKDKILEMYSLILPVGNAKIFVDQIFRIFDKDGNGSIDFKEFMLATDMTASGTPEEKLRWAFKMYDKDGSGSIELPEMIEIFGTLYDIEGVSKEKASERAKKIFSGLDVDGDGELTCEEFVKGCMADSELIQLLNSGGISGQQPEDTGNK